MQNREIRLRVSDQLFADLSRAAKYHGIPVTNVVKLALNDYLRKNKPTPLVTDMSVWLDDDGEPINVSS